MFRNFAVPFVLLVALLGPALSRAQEAVLQPSGEPEAGVVTLQPGFAPDPLRVPALVGGGKIDAVQRQLGQDCAGFISETPDVRVSLGGALPLLRLIFIADAITVDTTLVVHAPDGTYRCGNNTNGLFNPMVNISGAAPGDYAIWIGGFTPEGPVYGDLFVTTNANAFPGSTDLVLPVATTPPTAVPPEMVTPTPQPGTFLDSSLPPAHVDVALAHGFLPDPFRAVVVGGGELALPPSTSADFSGCAGFVTAGPDLRLTWSGVSPRLRFHLVPLDDVTDAALVVRTPDGRWLCNAEFAPGYTDPSVEVLDPLPGVYTVWAANESAFGARFAASLYVTEKTSTPETVERAGTPALANVAGLDAFAAGSPVRFDLTGPDPLALSAPLGFAIGAVDLAALNAPAEGQPVTGCEGYAAAAPALTVDLPVAYPYLRVFFIGAEGTDPTLVVRMPDGRWYCNDDSFGSKSPAVDIMGPAVAGQAQIWVGNYGALDTSVAGTLYLTRGSASPANPSASVPFTGLDEINLAPPPALIMPTAVATGPLNPYAEPNFGSAALNSANPPHVVAVTGGGTQDASKANAACTGAVSAQPDFRFDWGGPAVPLRLFVVGDGDPTLVVLGPDGVFRCNDDSSSVFPTVDVPAALPGAYAVWVGSYDAAVTAPGWLTITEDLSLTPVGP
ncbi:MAG: hypothetical protein JNL34_13655 [Anaerolineae bacterium]|nr:hypothetical protein [Anaerolineae bacterium]